MPRLQLSLRGLLLFAISALTLIIALLAAEVAYETWTRLDKLNSLRDAILLSDQMFDATEKVAVERDVALSMLQATDEQAVERLRPRLMDSRREVDAAIGATTQALAGYDLEGLSPLRSNVDGHLLRIHALRARIDRDLAAPKAQRDLKLAERWNDEASSFLLKTHDLWNGFIRHFTDIDPVVTQHLRLKHFMRRLIDYTSRERSLIGQLIAENRTPRPEEVSQLLRGRGATELSWQFSRLLADQSGLYPSIAAEYGDALSHQSTLQEMVPGGAT